MLLDLADVVTGQQEVTQIQQAAQNWCQLCHTNSPMALYMNSFCNLKELQNEIGFQIEVEADNKPYSQCFDSRSLLALNLVGVEAWAVIGAQN